MAQIEINIDDYISESEKKEYAIEAFKEKIKSGLFKSNVGTVQEDSEIQRIIGNITSHIVMEEVQKYIPNYKKLIKQKTLKVLNKDSFSYEVFKKKDVWDKEESLAVQYMNEEIKKNKELFQKRIKETIENYDLSDDISKEVSKEFDKMAGTMYSLADLFNRS